MFQIVSTVLDCVAILYQKRYNRLHRSIYGLSYDLYVLTSCSCAISIYCTLQYMFSPLARSQLSKRFPLFYPHDDPQIPISKALLLVESMNLICSCFILRQLIRYRATQHIHQGISYICASIVIGCVVFSIFTFACSSVNLPDQDMGKFGIFYLEHINYLWVIGNSLSCFRLVPQITINWMGTCTQGISSKFVVVSTLAAIIALMGELLSSSALFYKVPLNHKPAIESIGNLIFLLVILYQAQFVYVGGKPILPRRRRS